MVDPDSEAHKNAAAYPASIFVHYLKNLDAMLDKAELLFCVRRDQSLPLLEERLATDMFPLIQQLNTAVGFSLRAICPLAAVDMPPLPGAKDLAEVRGEIGRAVDFLESIPERCFAGFEQRRVYTVAGFANRQLGGRDFLLLYAFPNFLFHLCMAYAILRQQGAAIGKQDFDSLHSYPEGFSFPDPVNI